MSVPLSLPISSVLGSLNAVGLSQVISIFSRYSSFRLLLPDDCQPDRTEYSDTLNVQAVPVQTVLLLSCDGCADSKNDNYSVRSAI